VELLSYVGPVKSCSNRFGDSVSVLLGGDGVSVSQDRCTVCAKRTIGLVNILDAPKVLQGDKAQVEACYGPFGDSAFLQDRCTVCAERNISLDIVLDAPDGTAR
jgi:hypothetical protein